MGQNNKEYSLKETIELSDKLSGKMKAKGFGPVLRAILASRQKSMTVINQERKSTAGLLCIPRVIFRE